MNNTRARFEEIWPVPEGVIWSEHDGEYLPEDHKRFDELYDDCARHDARLDTFTSCQESMAPVLSLIEEMVADIEYLIEFADGNEPYSTTETLNQAKQLLEQKK